MEAYNLTDFQAEAKRLIDAAQAQARQILAQAQKDSISKVQAAFEEGKKIGFQKGYQDGLTKGQAEALEKYSNEIKSALAILNQAAGEIAAMKEKIADAARDEVLRLSVKIAERIISAQIKIDPEVVMNNINKCIELACARETIEVKVNPADYDTIQTNLSAIRAAFSEIREIVLSKDDSISRGSCVVKTNISEIESEIQEELRQVEELLCGK